jgi:hypothetical protein
VPYKNILAKFMTIRICVVKGLQFREREAAFLEEENLNVTSSLNNTELRRVALK